MTAVVDRQQRAPRSSRWGLAGWGLILALVGAWQLAAVLRPARYLPPFTDVAAAYVRLLTGEPLLSDVIPSVERVVLGLAVGIVVGVVLGVVIGQVRSLDPWVRPVLEFLRALPGPAFIPAAMILLGIGTSMRVAVIALGSVWPILLNAIDATRRIDPLQVDVARMSGLGPTAIMRRVVLPSIAPHVFAGVRISAAIALIMMVISELIAATSGIGALILTSQRLFRVADTYAGVLVLGTIGWLLATVLLAVERRTVGWYLGWRSSTS